MGLPDENFQEASSDGGLAQVQRTAQSFIRAMEDQSIVIHFLESVYEKNSFADIAQALKNAVARFSLNSVVQLREGEHAETFADYPVAELEEKLLGHLRGSDEQFIEVRGRLIINFPRATMLIKNMVPVDDERYTALKDHLTVMLKAIDGRLTVMNESSEGERKRKTSIESLLSNTKSLLGQVQTEFSQRHDDTVTVMKHMIDKLETSLVGLGLDEDQEKYIYAIAEEALTALYSIVDSHHELDNVSEQVLAQLHALAE